MITIPLDVLRAHLAYDPKTGLIKRLIKPSKGHFNKNWYSGSLRKDGYYRISIDGTEVLVHRVALALTNGEWPTEHTDHRNGITSDNRLCNLRVALPASNMQNKRLDRRNKTGYHGVFYVTSTRQYRVRINHNCKMIYIGTYNTLAKAVEARKRAEQELGYHPNHGKKFRLITQRDNQ